MSAHKKANCLNFRAAGRGPWAVWRSAPLFHIAGNTIFLRAPKNIEIQNFEPGAYAGPFPAILGKGPWPKLGKNDRLNIKIGSN